MSAKEYKEFKGLRKESLMDSMSDVEVALTDLGEIATRELVKEYKPYGLTENKKIAKAAKDSLKRKLGKSIVCNKNKLGYKYVDDSKLLNKE